MHFKKIDHSSLFLYLTFYCTSKLSILYLLYLKGYPTWPLILILTREDSGANIVTKFAQVEYNIGIHHSRDNTYSINIQYLICSYLQSWLLSISPSKFFVYLRLSHFPVSHFGNNFGNWRRCGIAGGEWGPRCHGVGIDNCSSFIMYVLLFLS